MATIKTSFGTGGSGLTPNASAGAPSLATALREIIDDLTALRVATIGLAAKLDDDGTVTDTNYEELWTPAALTSIKG